MRRRKCIDSFSENQRQRLLFINLWNLRNTSDDFRYRHSNSYNFFAFNFYLNLQIYIHDPYNYADDSATPKLIGPSVQAFMEIDSETTYATDSIKNMDLIKRKCTIFSELSSKYFSKYTYTNCLAECRSKIVFNMCGCVPIFLPARSKDFK